MFGSYLAADVGWTEGEEGRLGFTLKSAPEEANKSILHHGLYIGVSFNYLPTNPRASFPW